tara:strand:+ start:246 stop:785 length:540 start_codon:yes stop_codon:yes gene_type:complete
MTTRKIKLKIPITNTFEKIDIVRAEKIANIDDEILIPHIEKGNTHDAKKKYSPKDYCKVIKKLCNKYIKNNGCNVDYKFSSRMVNNGRLYADGFSISNLKSCVRGYLCEKYYYDLDMTNAHPTILLYLMKTYYPDHKWNFLKAYIKNRDITLQKINKDRNTAKKKNPYIYEFTDTHRHW